MHCEHRCGAIVNHMQFKMIFYNKSEAFLFLKKQTEPKALFESKNILRILI